MINHNHQIVDTLHDLSFLNNSSFFLSHFTSLKFAKLCFGEGFDQKLRNLLSTFSLKFQNFVLMYFAIGLIFGSVGIVNAPQLSSNSLHLILVCLFAIPNPIFCISSNRLVNGMTDPEPSLNAMNSISVVLRTVSVCI